jgi:HSP20 family protein
MRSHRPGASFNGGRRLPVDVMVDEERYTIIAEVPGLETDEVEIQLEDDILTLWAKPTEEEMEDNGVKTLWQERYSGEMIRRIRLSKPVNREEIEAFVEKGILTVHLPLADEIRPKQIKVQAK